MRFLLDDHLGHVFLATHRIDAHDGARQIELRQQAGNGGDFVGLVGDRAGRQHQPGLGREGADHMHHAVFAPASPQTLAIDGDLVSRQCRQAGAYPFTEGGGEGIPINPADDVAQGVMRRDAIG